MIFVYTQLNVKTVLFQTIQFSVSTISMKKTVPFQTIQLSIEKQFYFKQFSFVSISIWTPTYGRAKAGRPARTYIQQLCEDTGCSPEDLPEAMNDREKWRERVRDICTWGTTWWWWWDATTLSQNRPGSDGNQGVLCIPQISSITGTPSPDSLVSYPEKQLVHSTAPADLDLGHSLRWRGLTPLQRCSRCILEP